MNYNDNDLVGKNITIIDVALWPDPINDSEYHHIIAYDGETHFVWNSRAKSVPDIGDKFFLRAIIKSKTDQTEFEIPAYLVRSVSLLKYKETEVSK